MARIRDGESVSPKRRSGAIAAAVAALTLGLSVALPQVPTARAEGPSQLSLDKSVSESTVSPGQTISYDLEVGCSAIDVGVGCTNATLVDPVPAEFDVVAVTVGAGLTADEPSIEGNTVTVVFTSPLQNPPGSVGLLASASGIVTITVRAKTDLPYEANGVPVDNTAQLTATNQIAPVASTATVTPSVPLELGVSASKSFAPTIATAVPGTPVTLTMGGTSTSNAGVDSLTILDPVDPAATPNPFDYLAVTGIGAVTFPEGADQVEVDAWVGGTWITQPPAATTALPPGVDPAQVTGLRFIFTSSDGATLPSGAHASAALELAQRDEVAALPAALAVRNTVGTEVALGGATADDAARATYVITRGTLRMTATKSFSPDEIVAGDPSTVTLGGSNASLTPIDELSITEPSPTAEDLYTDGFTDGVTFEGFTDEVVWPIGATAASVHFYYSDGTDEVIAAEGRDTLPDATAGKTVVRFTVTFTGSIQPGQSASVPFVVQTDTDLTRDSVVLPDTASVTGTAPGASGQADASANLTVYTTRLAVGVDKRIAPNQILSTPGNFVTVQLPAQVRPFPASTTDAHVIVVQDPAGTPPALTDWWNHFDATAITQTAVPAGGTMTIRYWDGDAWLPLPGAVGIVGPTVFSVPIDPALRDDVLGLQFVYTSVDGFPPGTSVQPNISMELRTELRDGSGPATGEAETIENCAGIAATGDRASATNRMTPPCPAVTLVPGDFPGADDFLSKTWVGPKAVTARSADQVPVALHWSTGGRASLQSMVVSDVADPASTALADSAFNVFDLVGVPAISASQDPDLKYDAVSAVQLFNGTLWVDAANDPCPAACVGTFPGLALTSAERASTIGVRLVFVESPNRAAVIDGDPTGPPVGSGVARSIGNDREIVLTFQLRDEVRSPVTTPDPVTGTRQYNTGEPGAVENTARATGTSSIDGTTVTDTAADTIRILDVPLNVTARKQWTGGPLGVPQPGTDPSLYPSGRVRITATNATAANVDELTVADPSAPGSADPFDEFTLVRIVTISVPPGATSGRVELTGKGGLVTSYTRNQALALTASQLANVVGIRVVFDGRIDAGATATVAFDTRLRPTHRADGTPVTVVDSPISNTAEVGVSDEGGAPGGSPTASSTASMVLAAADISVAATKTLNPGSQTEPDRSPVTVTLTGQPGGTVRASVLTVTDERGTFWNAVDFLDLASPLALAAPIDRVRIDACVDRDWSDPTEGCVAAGGHWVIGALSTAAQASAQLLPDGVAAPDVEGLRFTFTRADGSGFENPEDPTQTVSLSVQRRVELRSGGAVPSDLPGTDAAPGETDAGEFSNTATASVTGVFTAGGAPYQASDSASEQLHYIHAISSVAVTKSPAGVQQPGAVIPFHLRATNTGDIAITDPVITDRIPSDGDGPLLVFDPFADPANGGPYSYVLSGTAPVPASGPAMPTTPADVTAAVSGGGTQIRFSFPPGTVLEAGQTYDITIRLMFRTGLPAGTTVTNAFGIRGDRPFDSCGGTADADSGECRAASTLSVQIAAALRGVKSVRATDPSLGVLSTLDGFACVPGADGFYAGPCVPITRPGDTETWRLGLINTGTLPMDRMVSVDKLPTPGDTGALVTLPRGSQFRPTFTGAAELAQAPADADFTVFTTTDAAPCVDDLLTTGIACPAGAWTQLSASTTLDTVTGLKFVVDFPTPIPPGGSIAIDMMTRTPGSAPDPAADPIAWNTQAVGGRVQRNGSPVATARTEGNKVGVTLATGSLSVVKSVTGDGADYAPGTFPGTLDCVSAGETVAPIPIVLTDGTPITVDDLPLGAQCTVTEADSGQTSSTSTTATVGASGDPIGLVMVTNRYDLAGLVVTKTVQSAAVDASGKPVEYGPFPVTVECEFLGSPVYADGYGPTEPMAAALESGEFLTLTGLPAGATCTVSETDALGATSTTIEATTARDPGSPVSGTSTVIDLTPDAGSRPTNSVGIVNAFDVGSLHLIKIVDGLGADDFGAGPFLLTVTCTLDDASGSREVWNGIVRLGGTRPLEATVNDIAAGAQCAVEESGAGGATASTVAPSTVTIGSGTEVTVTASNTFGAGAIHVVKERIGEGVDAYGAGPFTVSLECTLVKNGVPSRVAVPGGATRVLNDANNYETDYAVLPDDALCHLSETASGGATASRVLDADGNPAPLVRIADGETAQLVVQNTFAVGSLVVVKSVTGDSGGATFVVRLACSALVDRATTKISIPGGATRSLSQSTSLRTRYDGLPAGARCVLRETSTGGADRVTMSPSHGDDSVARVTVGDGTTVRIAVTNIFDPPGALAATGFDGVAAAIAGAVLLLSGGMLVFVFVRGPGSGRRRRSARVR